MAGNDVLTPKEIQIENEEWVNNLWKQPYLPHIVGAPCSEFFSVTVNLDYFGQRDTIEIYGCITLYDENNTPYELYCRPSDDPETLTRQYNVLSLDIPVECLLSTTWLHMYLSLKDKANEAIIVKKDLYFDRVTNINQYNKVQKVDHDFVCVTYVAFSAAVLAIIEITLIKKNDSAPAPLNLSGNIIARCGNTYGQEYPGIVLLNIPSNQPIKAVFDQPIDISRDVVVVPAYSFLRIDVQLSQTHPHQQDDITCRADFLARHLHIDQRDIVDKDYVVRFNVQWCHPYQLNDEATQPFECPKISPDLQVHGVGRIPRSLVEVYTVVIHHDTNRELKIFGKMSLRDNWARFLLFGRKVLNPVELSGNEETLPIEVKRRCFNMSEYLGMELKLKDLESRVMIQGVINWNDYSVKEPMSWYDKHICSVIRGVRGYAAVFYTIFSSAMQAEVAISFKCDEYPDVSHRLSGSVVARHSKGTYVTEYDKAYYQSVLFRGNTSDLKSGCTLPLSKSVVAVPMDAFLTVVIDLHASPPSCELPEKRFTSDVTFNMSPDVKRIKGDGNCFIEVSVEWNCFRKLLSEGDDSSCSDTEM